MLNVPDHAAHIAYFVPLIKIADFLRAGVEVRSVSCSFSFQAMLIVYIVRLLGRNIVRLQSYMQVNI